MKRKGKIRRGLACLLSLALCLGMLPGMALAAETTYTMVTSADEFTTGQYYMVTDTGYAPGVLDGTWVTAVAEADAAAQAVWTLTVDGTTVKIQDANNTYIAPKGGYNNGIVSGEYAWSWKFENGVFTFSGQGEDTVVLASNKSSQNRFRAYKTTTVSGTPGGYPSEFTLYKAEVGSEPGEDTVAAPQSSPQAGEVTSGTEITLSTTTSGASIYYTLNGDDPTTSSAQYSDDNKPKIEGTVGAEVILKAVPVLEVVYSAVQTLQYTIIEEDQPPTESPIEAGHQEDI